ncbi:MAG: acetate--CoA ligase family protein [Chloroflexi bacterium]|nr:acetate--CoA ligase family protein [Chloroflexota bacterium]
MHKGLKPFFAPRGVAVVGASQHPQKLGYGLARNLLLSDYQGAIRYVNPKGGVLFGQPIHARIEDAPGPVDLAVLLVPAEVVAGALEECGQAGVRAAIIASGGFSEVGAAGRALEQECLAVARKWGMRVVGPNCIGILDTHLPLDTTFLPPPGPPAGSVAFISHSGAICAAVIDWARGQGFGLSRLVSLGNQIDVNETDVLAAVAEDRHTRVVTMYLEGVSDGRRFVQAAGRVAQEKPVLALKVGRYASGQQAVASHTGALAGQEKAFNAAFRRAGVIRADTSEEMFDWARALAWSPLPRGRRVAVLTNAGGPGATAADALEAHRLTLARLGPETRAGLRALLPPAASVQNPVDMLASASPEHYAHSLALLLDDAGVDAVMVILPPPPMYTAAGVANAMIPIIQTAAKPVVVALMGERMIQEAMERLRAAHIPEYRFPERAASALAVLADRAESIGRSRAKPRVYPDVNRRRVAAILRKAGPGASGFLSERDAAAILAAYGLPTLPTYCAANPAAAAAAAEKAGFPVALKIDSPDIPHKSDVGGVVLNLTNAAAVAREVAAMLARVQVARPEALLNGVQVQRMAADGQEVILGAVQDDQFGALLMFGSGGVEVEGLEDVAFALAPATEEEIRYLLDSTWAGRKLAGFRSLPPADRAAAEEALGRLGQLAGDFPVLQEIEINPLRVLPAGQGALAVDARIRLIHPYSEINHK